MRARWLDIKDREVQSEEDYLLQKDVYTNYLKETGEELTYHMLDTICREPGRRVSEVYEPEPGHLVSEAYEPLMSTYDEGHRIATKYAI